MLASESIWVIKLRYYVNFLVIYNSFHNVGNCNQHFVVCRVKHIFAKRKVRFVEICYENFWLTSKNFRQPKNFRLLQQLGGATAPQSTPSNTPMILQVVCKQLLSIFFVILVVVIIYFSSAQRAAFAIRMSVYLSVIGYIERWFALYHRTFLGAKRCNPEFSGSERTHALKRGRRYMRGSV